MHRQFLPQPPELNKLESDAAKNHELYEYANRMNKNK